MPPTYDILFSLHDLFGGKGMSVRQVAFKAIMNTKKGTLIRDHIFFMMGIFNEMEILGAKINGETQVDMVLELIGFFQAVQA